MEIYEKISLLIKEQNISKKEFAIRLRNLEPRLKITGDVPSEKTIYGYLAGRISISIELIPYIAEALRVTEQELFLTTFDKRVDFYKKMVSTATDEELFMIKEKIQSKQNLGDIFDASEDIEKLINPLVEKLERLKNHIES